MRKHVFNWNISKLLRLRDNITLAPAYQRGPAWTKEKQTLLIDSIYRDYDLPKLYLAAIGALTNNRFEVIDGQQRLKAIYAFIDGDVSISESSVRGGTSRNKLRYSELSATEKQKLNTYKVTVSIAECASSLYKRTLFARLQLGERLNPAELRNALQSSAPTELRSIAQTHIFFTAAGIADKRYKREDYLTHVFAYMELDRDNPTWKDIKAPKLKEFILRRNRGIDQTDLDNADEILEYMHNLLGHQPSIFKNKWSFFDGFIHAYRNLDRISQISNFQNIAAKFKILEDQRRNHHSTAETLLSPRCRIPNRESLYHYILAYKAGGAIESNIALRAQHLDNTITL